MTKLTWLDIGDTLELNRINGVETSIASLAAVPNLMTLCAKENDLGNEGAADLAALTNLTDLNVFQCAIGAAGAASLATLTRLKFLDITENPIGAARRRREPREADEPHRARSST